jgi:hypothetical protein
LYFNSELTASQNSIVWFFDFSEPQRAASALFFWEVAEVCSAIETPDFE